MVISVKSLSESLRSMIPTEKVKVRQVDGIISLIPFREEKNGKPSLLGLAADSTLTVEKFLAMKREDRMLEGLCDV
jgi:hypothetical protein